MDTATVGVLRDVFFWDMLALALGLVVYAYLRSKSGPGWYQDGRVNVGAFDAGDGIVAMMLIFIMSWSLINAAQGAHPAPAQAPAVQKTDASEANNIATLIVSDFVFVCMGGALIMYLWLFRGLNPIELFGLRRVRPGTAIGLAIIWVTGAIIAMMVLQNFLEHFIPDDSPQQENVVAFRKGSFGFKVLMAGSAVIVAPLVEELLFRGFIYGVTKRFTERRFATLFSAVLFAVAHNNVLSLFPLMLLAIILAVAYEMSGSLTVPMSMHAIFNAWNLTLMWLEKQPSASSAKIFW